VQVDDIAVRWGNFFVAEVGATAALGGLLIVAVSINLQRIIAITHLPGRAFEALVLLLGGLLLCSASLIPGQPLAALGGEILAIECLVVAVSAFTQIKALRNDAAPQMTAAWVERIVAIALTAAPIGAGGIMLCLGCSDGVYLVALGVLIAITASVATTWILLVEILR
jgi:hypothetical protein